jgi:hypothetical protein
MAFCSSCGSQLSDAARFCSTCGASGQGGQEQATAHATSGTALTPEGQRPQPQTSPAGPRNPNVGCGKFAAIGCGVLVGLFVLLLILGAIVSSFGHSASQAPSEPSKTTLKGKNAKPAAPPKPHVLIDVEGSGIKTTQRFVAPDEWALAWTYDCSNFGSSGNFVISVEGDSTDVAANQLGQSGHDVSYEHSGGNVYLEINSECAWHVRAVSQ